VFALTDAHDPTLYVFPDAKLAKLVQQGNSEAFAELTVRYMSVIRAKVAPFHSKRVEADDLCQEGLLGLLNAARTFNPQNGTSFRTYAGVCIYHKVVMAYRASAGRKNDALNNSISLSDDETDNSAVSAMSNDVSTDPEALLSDRESFKIVWHKVASLLTPMEASVLRFYVGGCSYQEIAQKMSITTKAADNALQRARCKLKHTL
jgi:RNA polymerase sporulation-specific sigma factor